MITRTEQIAGDTDFLTYGGTFLRKVFENNTERLEVWYVDEGLQEDLTESTTKVYRYTLYPDSDENLMVTVLDWVDWVSVAAYVGTTVPELFEWGDGELVNAVADYYGWVELDQYPVELTYSEIVNYLAIMGY